MAKIPKRTLATRNPVVGEFMGGIVMVEARFVRYKLRIIGVTLS